MPKVKISEYSATANSNTDVASINIDEGCAPSGINNAIRAIMGHLKDFQQGTNGDPFNGPHNGTVGATTPSTGAFTTLSATGAIQTGSGNSTAAGLIAGYFGASGYGAIWSTSVTPSTTNFAFLTNGTSTVLNGSGNVTIQAGNVDKVAVSSTGLAVTGLVDISAATSGQIKFPATQNASANANTLDDYEEGTWTATFVVDSGSVTTSASIRYGFYTKIGRQVTITCMVAATAISSPTGSLYIFTLPFPVSSTTGSDSAVSISGNNFTSSAATTLVGGAPAGASYIQINSYNAGSQSLMAANLTSSSSVNITATYFTA